MAAITKEKTLYPMGSLIKYSWEIVGMHESSNCNCQTLTETKTTKSTNQNAALMIDH